MNAEQEKKLVIEALSEIECLLQCCKQEPNTSDLTCTAFGKLRGILSRFSLDEGEQVGDTKPVNDWWKMRCGDCGKPFGTEADVSEALNAGTGEDRYRVRCRACRGAKPADEAQRMSPAQAVIDDIAERQRKHEAQRTGWPNGPMKPDGEPSRSIDGRTGKVERYAPSAETPTDVEVEVEANKLKHAGRDLPLTPNEPSGPFCFRRLARYVLTERRRAVEETQRKEANALKQANEWWKRHLDLPVFTLDHPSEREKVDDALRTE